MLAAGAARVPLMSLMFSFSLDFELACTLFREACVWQLCGLQAVLVILPMWGMGVCHHLNLESWHFSRLECLACKLQVLSAP